MGVMAAVAAVGVVAAVMANQEAKKGANAQIDAANAAKDAFKGVRIPTIEEQKIILQTP